MMLCTQSRVVFWAKVCLTMVVGFTILCPATIVVCTIFPVVSPVFGALADAWFWCTFAMLCGLCLLGLWQVFSTPGVLLYMVDVARHFFWWMVSERYRAQVRHKVASVTVRRSWEHCGVLVGEGNYYAYTSREMELRAARVRGMLVGSFGASVNPLNPKVPMVFDGVVPGGRTFDGYDDSQTVPLGFE